MCSYLEKSTSGTLAPHLTARWKRRFIVLTSTAVHWFKRIEGYDLFGEELGSVLLKNITSVKPCNNPTPDDAGSSDFFYFSFEAKEEGNFVDTLFLRQFRAPTKDQRDEWVNALHLSVSQTRLTRTPLKGEGRSIQAASNAASNAASRATSRATSFSVFNDAHPSLHAQRRNTIDGVSLMAPFMNSLAHVPPAPPRIDLLTLDDTVLSSVSSGSLPLTYGYNSTPINLTLTDTNTAVLHITNHQSITLTQSILGKSSANNGKEIQVPVDVLEASVRNKFHELGEELCLVDNCVLKVDITNAATNTTTTTTTNTTNTTNTSNSSITLPYLALVTIVLAAALNSSDVTTRLLQHYSLTPPDPIFPVAGSVILLTLHQLRNLLYAVFLKHNKPPTTTTITYSLTILSLVQPQPTEEEDPAGYPHEITLPPVPIRFINGTVDQGGLNEATRRWQKTHQWRTDNYIDELLLNPIPEFYAIKNAYPLFYCGRTKPIFEDPDGNKISHVCYYEQIGKVNFEKCSEIGMPALQKFIQFVVEFVYTYFAPYEHSKIFNIVDVKDFALSEVKGELLTFFKFITNLSQDHYLERASVICVVNAPMWFSMLWRVVKPMINENTQKKVRVLSAKETFQGLCEFIEPDQIPEEYGGTLVYKNDQNEKVSVRDSKHGSELERAIFMYVERLNSGKPLPRPPHFNREDVTEAWKKHETREGLWDSDLNDPLGPSDVHLPLHEQKSRFALDARGIEINEDGNNARISEIRRHSVSDIGSADGDVSEPRGTDSPTNRPIRRDSTVEGMRTNRTARRSREFGESDSESEYDDSVAVDDSERDEMRRLRKQMGSVDSQISMSSVSVGGFFTGTEHFVGTEVIMEGWLNKKASGVGFFGRRSWASRWAKLVIGVAPKENTDGSPVNQRPVSPTNNKSSDAVVPMLLFYWFESSPNPSSFMVLDESVVVPVERPTVRNDGAEEGNKHCFDIVHLPAKRVTRSFSALDIESRDKWVKCLTTVMSEFQGGN
jgi:hypothetical protein